jgi:hypothetical protein
MASWQKKHYEAMADYAKRNELRLAMGRYPNAQFIDKDGKQITKHINDLLVEHETSKKDSDRERRRVKIEEENRKPWHERFKQR